MDFNKDVLYFIPLGGSNEIGMNLNLYGFNNNWIIVDMGIMFAGDEFPGIDVILPDTFFIDSITANIKAIFITHSHEDHIGGLQYLFNKFNCPIYLTDFAKKVLEFKVRHTDCDEGLFLKEVHYQKPISVGPFEVIYGAITHSVPESSILSISVGNKLIVHSGDWKIDQKPLVGDKTDTKFLKKLSKKGVDVLVCDSTNIFNSKPSGSEYDVRKNLLEIIKKSKSNRVFVTTFASNIARLSTLIYIAENLKIKICFIGGSLNRSFDIARSCGYLSKSPNQINFNNIPEKEKTIIVCTGCQGEPRAALSQIAYDFHKIKLKDNDLVIFSSKIIPGNEKKLYKLHNQLVKDGIEVISEETEFIHVSGHPNREDLKDMYQWVKPKCVIPVHGEHRHMIEHINFAKEMQVPHPVQVENGDIVKLYPGEVPEVYDKAPSGRLYLDGNVSVEEDSQSIKDRRNLSSNGYLEVTILITPKGNIHNNPVTTFRGLPIYEKDEFIYGLEDEIEKTTRAFKLGNKQQESNLIDALKIACRKFTKEKTGKRPYTNINLVRI